jgi:hypothetical protein
MEVKQQPVLDMSWVKMSFASMPEEKLQAYNMLRALGHCSSDSFQSIVNLFEVVLENEDGLSDGEDDSHSMPPSKETSEKFVDASDLLDCLEKLSVKHVWDIEDAETFVKTLSPDPEQDGLRVLDLDKAVCRVREDMLKRLRAGLPGFGTGDAFYRSAEYEYGIFEGMSNPARSPLGNLALGDQARSLEKEDGWLCKPGETTASFLFGQAAFMESLLRIAFKHLHCTGLPAQTAMPGGAKAVWLMTYLHYRFEHIRQGDKSPKGSHQFDLESTRPGTEASTRPTTTESEMDGCLTRPPSSATALRAYTSTNLSQSMLNERPRSVAGRKEGSSNIPSKLPALGTSMPSAPKLTSSMTLPTGNTWQGCSDAVFKIPEAVEYLPKRLRAIERHSDVFEKLPWMQKGPGEGSLCQNCKFNASREGIGNLFCHECSGIDSMRLSGNPLWPVIYRRRARREIYLAEIAEKVKQTTAGVFSLDEGIEEDM